MENNFHHGHYEIVFYSINPYRRKEFPLKWKIDESNYLKNHKNNFNSVRHVRISSSDSLLSSNHHFPNATELTLENISCNHSDSLINHLKQSISLENVSKLNIMSMKYSFGKVIELLSLIPNINTLEISRIFIDLTQIDQIENSESFQRVSKRTRIRNVIITRINQVEEIQFLFNLCSQIQICQIHRCQNCTASIVRLLTAKNIDIAPNLVSLHIGTDDKSYLYRLDIVIRSGKLINDWNVNLQQNLIHLWK
ncbi:unnamed protein product [Adineta ricciae]|uniref:Uncharacterized protein n=1 Tax=Adineta ricciae TaxID=249248 RepID=A0A814T048_ADIRI|nr:unnamed protein product [Adineta ricciae]CAF1471233.1 unnamed protein product [Adineta ricciae]